MDIFDQNILGYERLKETLRQISDMLQEPEAYEICGVRIPCSILLVGPVHSGKRTLCRCLAEDCGRSALSFRNNTDPDQCREELEQLLKEAVEKEPSILICENIQTYDEGTSACLSAGLDACRGSDVLVIATAASLEHIPPYVLARFDHKLTVKSPVGTVWEELVEKYIEEKVPMHLADDVTARDIAMALDGRGYTALEEVMNRSSAKAVYAHALAIRKEDVAKSILEVLYRYEESDEPRGKERMRQIAIHEASHVVVSEEQYPGAGTFVATPKASDCFYSGVSDSLHLPYHSDQDTISATMIALAGMAGEELFLGVPNGVGAGNDLQQALSNVDYLISECRGAGFSGLIDKSKGASEQRKARIELLKEAKLEELYAQTKAILHRNRSFVQALADELLVHESLFHTDIMRIKEQTANQMQS